MKKILYQFPAKPEIFDIYEKNNSKIFRKFIKNLLKILNFELFLYKMVDNF